MNGDVTIHPDTLLAKRLAEQLATTERQLAEEQRLSALKLTSLAEAAREAREQLAALRRELKATKVALERIAAKATEPGVGKEWLGRVAAAVLAAPPAAQEQRCRHCRRVTTLRPDGFCQACTGADAPAPEQEPCSYCKGVGTNGDGYCAQCNGSGFVLCRPLSSPPAATKKCPCCGKAADLREYEVCRECAKAFEDVGKPAAQERRDD